jgi:hypothetical protein
MESEQNPSEAQRRPEWELSDQELDRRGPARATCVCVPTAIVGEPRR